MKKLTDFNQINFNFKSELIEEIDNKIDKKYIEKIQDLSVYDNSRSKLKIIFSSLHGTGITQIPNALNAFGFKNISSVKSQELPDPEFSTVTSPNPEDLEMLHEIAKVVKENNAEIGFGFDGDGDRVGVIDNEGNEIFSDKIGLLIARNLSTKHKKF